MLNDKNKSEWTLRVKSIFTEAQKKYTEDAENGGLDLGGAPEEDPAIDAAPVDGAVDPVAGVPGEEEEPEPTVTLTASLLKALLDYSSAPDEEEIDVDPAVDAAPVDETLVNPSMTAPAVTTNTGVMENALPPVPAAPEGEVDDALAGGDESGEEVVDAEGEEVSSDEIVQRLIDLSAENGGEALDVDVLAVVFAPEADEVADDLGDGALDGNVQLPATTGDQTLPPAPVETPVV